MSITFLPKILSNPYFFIYKKGPFLAYPRRCHQENNQITGKHRYGNNLRCINVLCQRKKEPLSDTELEKAANWVNTIKNELVK